MFCSTSPSQFHELNSTFDSFEDLKWGSFRKFEKELRSRSGTSALNSVFSSKLFEDRRLSRENPRNLKAFTRKTSTWGRSNWKPKNCRVIDRRKTGNLNIEILAYYVLDCCFWLCSDTSGGSRRFENIRARQLHPGSRHRCEQTEQVLPDWSDIYRWWRMSWWQWTDHVSSATCELQY